jgi:hypothetical protein
VGQISSCFLKNTGGRSNSKKQRSSVSTFFSADPGFGKLRANFNGLKKTLTDRSKVEIT